MVETPAKDYGDEPEFITKVVRPINGQDGDLLPVSAFKGIEDGAWPAGTAKFEKRGVSAFVPVWTADNCIECNKCAYSTRKSSQASTVLLPAR